VIPLLALTVTLLFAFVALAVDVGVLTIARTEAQNGCDAAALAGARVLNNRPTTVDNDRTAATDLARGIATSNINVFLGANKKYTVAENMTFGGGQQAIEVGQYSYNSGTQRFDVSFPANSGGTSWTAVRVRLKGNNPTFFAKVVGISSMPWETYATAVHRPRDIAIILDYSASMQFGSQFNWENGFSGSGGSVFGMFNPDPIYPQFGHYQRYTAYSHTVDPTGTNAGAATVSARANPLRMTRPHVMSGSGGSNEVTAPSNLTVETPGGPPMILDFRFDPANVSDPATKVTTPNPANYWNAFNRWMRATPVVENVFLDPGFRPAVSGSVDQGSHTERTFDWTGYNALDLTNQNGPTPAPDFYRDQSDGVVAYTGDRFARKGGQIFTASTSWDPTTATGAARDVRELLSAATANNSTLIALGTRTTAPPTVPTGYTFPSPNGDGGTSWDNFRDDLWERYGYDLDVARYSGTTPAGTNRQAAALRTANLFQGYSMGPGYYGKTFFMWPPDPRFDPNANVTAPRATNLATDTSGRDMHDWRRRFFYRGNFTEANANSATPTGRFDPQVDNDPTASNTQSINQCLLTNGTGRTLRDPNNGGSARYRVNYRAVLAWLKSGPQTLPPNLRAGRIVYYTSIPNDVDDLSDLDKRFWRDYIDFVLGYTFNVSQYDPNLSLAGNETRGFPEGVTPAVQATAQSGTNPRPYMNYTDNPSRPRLHFWFGPLSMLSFLNKRSSPGGRSYWLAGTVHEAQCWQLKAAMNSALDDIKNNHPNDFCSLVYFSNYNFQTPRVPMGQNWTNLKNSLFYPNSLLSAIAGGNTTTELRPYNSSMNNALVGNVPNANGGTDPVSGFAMAFNTMAGSAAYAARTPNGSVNGGTGRRGAAKICVFETDGVPNGRPQWAHQNAGHNSYYKEGGSSPGSSAADDAVQVVKKMCLAAGSGGFSLPSAPVRVYAIGFGDLFAIGQPGPYAGIPVPSSATNAKNFLLDIQQEGGTSAASDTVFPESNIITGPYTTRITNMRNILERIMQSGVQVTLVQ
jgi:Flp pilus assembly protein TadG